ncbi:cold shock domain-containing protein [Parafilimonas sp.]|uniref:cold shock domain-containing protein n=1 Tax=Parafilimonas sp. TaxID=1969739 RepID=UPI003F7D907E
MQLALLFRQEQNFKIPLELKNALDEVKGTADVQSYSNAIALYNELLIFWKSQNQSNNKRYNNERLRGRISSLNKEKGFGFIKSDKEDFYFKIHAIQGNKDKVSVGNNVSFAFHPANPGMKAIAYDIRLT